MPIHDLENLLYDFGVRQDMNKPTNSSSLGLVLHSFSKEVSPALTRVVLSVNPILSSCFDTNFEFSHNLKGNDNIRITMTTTTTTT